MKTDELIAVLSANARPVAPRQAEHRFIGTLTAAALLVLAITFLLLGLRRDMAAAAELPMFWLKLAFPASLAAAAWFGLRRLGCPGVRIGGIPLGIGLLLALMWTASAGVLVVAPDGQRTAMLFGSSWMFCLAAIPLLSLPALWLTFLALRGMTPTRPVLAGVAAGLFAGAFAGFAYAFCCPEMELPFVGVWYAAGMLIPAAVGGLIGRRCLRW